MYYSHKVYGHERGLSCCFRQPKADSHCALLHGYALSVELVFLAKELDDRNWVVDFGGLKQVERFLKLWFDHTLLVAEDDPKLDEIHALAGMGVADIRVMKHVGCEAFAEFVYQWVKEWLRNECGDRVRLTMVTVKEHGANGASYGE